MEGSPIKIEHLKITGIDKGFNKTYITLETKTGDDVAIRIDVMVDRRNNCTPFPTAEELESLKNRLFNISIEVVK